MNRVLDSRIAKEIEHWDNVVKIHDNNDWVGTPPDSNEPVRVPEYSSCLLSVYAFEEIIEREGWTLDYALEIAKIVGVKPKRLQNGIAFTQAQLIMMITATPAQRCEAALEASRRIRMQKDGRHYLE